MTVCLHFDKRQSFADMLRRPGAIIVPGAYDALSATLIEQAGFPAAYIGSFAAGASTYAIADVGALTLTELAEAAKRVASATSLPVLADGETGFYEPANVWRTVRAFEDAGVVGIHIEDNLGGKHSDSPAGLAPIEATAQRIRAGVEARSDENFQIIARSDALWVYGDLEECVRRLHAYVDAGATAVFAPGITAEQLRGVRGQFDVPFMVLGDLVEAGSTTPPSTIEEFEAAGADLVVLFYQLLGAASRGVASALASIATTRSIAGNDDVEAVEEFEARMGYDAYSGRVARYAVVQHV